MGNRARTKLISVGKQRLILGLLYQIENRVVEVSFRDNRKVEYGCNLMLISLQDSGRFIEQRQELTWLIF